ncbi:MAG: NADH-quinone oxidoreductase subunit C [Chrysiogenetes bacterium]|nr:NADH-quinone oxidoreductase subunit C [Chrysiogenetes bacterium]
MTSDEIIERLVKQFGDDKVTRVQAEGCPQPHALVPAELIQDVAKFLRDDPDLDCKFLATIAATDWLAGERKVKVGDEERVEEIKARIDVAYNFSSLTKKHRVNVKVTVDRDKPEVPTLTGVFIAADWHEREQYDLLGVNFKGHPDLRRLMMPEGWVGHPLRKDYEQMSEWQGIPTSRPKSHDLFRERLAREEAEEEAGA